jgi:hypothetical protein
VALGASWRRARTAALSATGRDGAPSGSGSGGLGWRSPSILGDRGFGEQRPVISVTAATGVESRAGAAPAAAADSSANGARLQRGPGRGSIFRSPVHGSKEDRER